ncbi:MAG TPA: toll/interleukin-1 receptor domain-containing protein [Ktedonobacterales bacterium]
MAKIFISYRREDTAEICGRIFDRLETHYGDHSVLKDVDSIPAGADFRAYLAHMVTQCDVMMVVIGPRWFGLDPYHPRIQDPNDFVRSEVELALRRGIPIIPVLVYGVDMPAATALPPSLAPLSFRHALWVRGDPDFRRDLDRVISGIDGMVAAKASATPGDATPVDLSPQARAHLEASPTPGATTTAGAPIVAPPSEIAPPASAGAPAIPATTATPTPTTGLRPPAVPSVPLPPPAAPLPSPSAGPATAAGAAGPYPAQPSFGTFAPVTGAPAMSPPVARPAPVGSGTFAAPPRTAPPSMPLGGPTWPGTPPPAAAAPPPARPPRRTLGRMLTAVVLAIVALAVVITGIAAVVAARNNDQAQRLAAAHHAATQTAAAARSYRAASPGPDCDHGGAQWNLSNAQDTCLSPGPGTLLAGGPDVTEIGTAAFYWPNPTSLPADVQIQVTIAQLSAGSCGGVLLRTQFGLTSGGSSGAYGFWVCDDGSTSIVSYDDTTGKPKALASTTVTRQDSYTLVASAVGTTLTLTLAGVGVPISASDATYTTTRSIRLGVDNYHSHTAGSAAFSNFSYTAES